MVTPPVYLWFHPSPPPPLQLYKQSVYLSHLNRHYSFSTSQLLGTFQVEKSFCNLDFAVRNIFRETSQTFFRVVAALRRCCPAHLP